MPKPASILLAILSLSLPAHTAAAPTLKARSVALVTLKETHCDSFPVAWYRIPWARLLAGVFSIDVLECPRCSSQMQRIAWIVPPDAIRKILKAVGLPADSPVPLPARCLENLFDESTAA